MKQCSKCSISKEVVEFCKSSKSRDKLHSWCKSCVSEARMRRYYENRTEERQRGNARNKAAYQKNMNYVYSYLLDNPCVDCGETDPVVLDFDHIDPDSKASTVAELCGRVFKIEKIVEEIEKCEVRCANCHRRRTANQFNWYAWRD